MLSAIQIHPKETIDFRSGLNRSFKGHHTTNCNFYIDDMKFFAIENNVDKYLSHLKCFEGLCGLDFSIDTQVPLVIQYWNKYRNMVLDWCLTLNGITAIPERKYYPV